MSWNKDTDPLCAGVTVHKGRLFVQKERIHYLQNITLRTHTQKDVGLYTRQYFVSNVTDTILVRLVFFLEYNTRNLWETMISIWHFPCSWRQTAVLFCCLKQSRRLSQQSPLLAGASALPPPPQPPPKKMTQEKTALPPEQPVRRVNMTPLFIRVSPREHASEK